MTNIFCGHYNSCGGCDFQEMDYGSQLEYKSTYCRNLFASFGCEPAPIVASPSERHFRNKMEFIVGGSAGEPLIGQRRKERFDQVVDLSECPVFSVRCGDLLEEARKWVKETGTIPYDVHKRTGELRYLSLRHSKTCDSFMMTVVAALTEPEFDSARERYSALYRAVSSRLPVASFHVCLNTQRADTALAAKPLLLHGEDHIVERVNGVEYIIRPETFFQTNTRCCERLYSAVMECSGGLQGHIHDIYCGSGGITLQLASAGRSVTGIDLSGRNIEDAMENRDHNRLTAEFVCADADEFIGGLEDARPWSMIVDPPRAGLTGKSIKVINGSGPDAFVYVSCNPLKLREDLKKLDRYAVSRLVPVDMFPHTRHMEVVCLLNRK